MKKRPLPYFVGENINILVVPGDHVYKAVDSLRPGSCEGCVFLSDTCERPHVEMEGAYCSSFAREDKRDVVWVEAPELEGSTGIQPVKIKKRRSA